VERVANQRNEIAKLKANAKDRANAAKAELEAMILGTKAVLTTPSPDGVPPPSEPQMTEDFSPIARFLEIRR
jgi:hypothetical protein